METAQNNRSQASEMLEKISSITANADLRRKAAIELVKKVEQAGDLLANAVGGAGLDGDANSVLIDGQLYKIVSVECVENQRGDNPYVGFQLFVGGSYATEQLDKRVIQQNFNPKDVEPNNPPSFKYGAEDEAKEWWGQYPTFTSPTGEVWTFDGEYYVAPDYGVGGKFVNYRAKYSRIIGVKTSTIKRRQAVRIAQDFPALVKHYAELSEKLYTETQNAITVMGDILK